MFVGSNLEIDLMTVYRYIVCYWCINGMMVVVWAPWTTCVWGGSRDKYDCGMYWCKVWRMSELLCSLLICSRIIRLITVLLLGEEWPTIMLNFMTWMLGGLCKILLLGLCNTLKLWRSDHRLLDVAAFVDRGIVVHVVAMFPDRAGYWIWLRSYLHTFD